MLCAKHVLDACTTSNLASCATVVLQAGKEYDHVFFFSTGCIPKFYVRRTKLLLGPSWHMTSDEMR